MTIVALQPGQSAADAAGRGGTLADPGPLASYEEANAAQSELQAGEEDHE